jgi:hypothetical protein
MPFDSPGKSRPVGSPRPKARMYFSCVWRVIVLEMSDVPMFDECTRMPFTFNAHVGWPSASEMTSSPNFMNHGTVKN